MTNASFLDAIALDESTHRVASRKAVVLAKTRVDNEYGKFIATHGESALDYLQTEIEATVRIACAEVGHADADGVVATVIAAYKREPEQKTAATEHESARLPKMCPFHKDVVNISLNAGDPAAGFNALQSQWGGSRHCEGEGFEGDKCKFKPQMTTQSYWDERSEKLEQKRQERAEREQQEAEQVETPEVGEDDSPEVGEDQTPEVEGTPEQQADVVELPLDSAEVEAPADGTELPMSMAASTKTADEGATGLGAPVPKMDKGRWAPKSGPIEGLDDPNGPHPTRRKDIVEPVHPDNSKELSEIGEQVTEHQDVTEAAPVQHGQGGAFSGGGRSAVSSHDPHKNELVEIMKDDFDGFLPQAEVQQAVLAHRNR